MNEGAGGKTMDVSLCSPASDSSLVHAKHKFDSVVGWVCL